MKASNRVEFQLVPFLPLSNFNIDVHGEIRALHKTLAVSYSIEGDVERLQVSPKAETTERRDLLWKHTCFELFFSEPSHNHYWEVNISSEGHWNWYSFDTYRAGMRPETLARLMSSKVEMRKNKIDVQFNINLEPLYVARKIQTLQLDLAPTIVLENVAFEHSYWALSHNAEKPDFHRRNGFELKLALD